MKWQWRKQYEEIINMYENDGNNINSNNNKWK